LTRSILVVMKVAAGFLALALLLGLAVSFLFPTPGTILDYRSTPLGGTSSVPAGTNNLPGGPDWLLGALAAGGALVVSTGVWIALRRR
jgi:hypothetical protein